MKAFLQALVKDRPADYVEARYEESTTVRIVYRGPRLETVSESVLTGGALRALVNGGWGFVSFNRPEDAEELVSAALAAAERVGRERAEKVTLAPVDPVEAEVRLDPGEDPRRISLARKVDLMGEYNRRIMAWGPPVTTSQVLYQEKFTRLWLCTSEGTAIYQEKLDLAGLLGAVATRRGLTQIARHGFGSSRDFRVARGLEGRVDEVCRLAADLLDAPVVQAGEYPVVCDPRLAGVFVHEAFGHLSEADDLAENPSLQQVMKLGRRFGRDILNIYDSGLEQGARGYLPFDDEGTPTEKTYLIREGVLVGRLHSRESAGRLGERPTGSARALDFRFPPICRMRNTGIEPGTASFEDLLEGIDLGVYAVDSYGGETNGEMFTFTAGYGRMIRNGELAELVREVKLTGNVFHTLENIDAIGRDVWTGEGPGGCGKGAQAPLPVSHWSPPIRIRRAVIGGR
ncbi:MAG: TldD/PmbA family protein [Bacillota bacterium]|nr:TldD/PmbA family protein [Bacillota bacterium]